MSLANQWATATHARQQHTATTLMAARQQRQHQQRDRLIQAHTARQQRLQHQQERALASHQRQASLQQQRQQQQLQRFQSQMAHQQARQQVQQALTASVGAFLTTTQAQRQANATLQAQSLSMFLDDLKQQTQDFLAAAAQQRQAESHHYHTTLALFRQQLQSEVAEALRNLTQARQALSLDQGAALAQYHADLQTATAARLAALSQQRQREAADWQNQLQTFHQDLRQAIQTYLSERAMDRQAEAAAVQAELQAFHDHIRLAVWGDGDPLGATPTPAVTLPEAGLGIPDPPNPEVDWLPPASVSDLESAPEPAGIPGIPEEMPLEAPPLTWTEPEPEPVSLAPQGETGPSEPMVDAAAWAEPEIPSPLAASLPPAAPSAVTAVKAPVVVMPDVDPTGQIVEFVTSYIEMQQQNAPGTTLLKVVGDRDQVRELLTRGAVDMGVDPSEILNVLRRMVAMSPLPV